MAETSHTLDLDTIERLATKVDGLIELLESTRGELNRQIELNDSLTSDLNAVRSKLSDAEQSGEQLQTQLTEREQIRAKVSDMLSQLDAINL